MLQVYNELSELPSIQPLLGTPRLGVRLRPTRATLGCPRLPSLLNRPCEGNRARVWLPPLLLALSPEGPWAASRLLQLPAGLRPRLALPALSPEGSDVGVASGLSLGIGLALLCLLLRHHLRDLS